MEHKELAVKCLEKLNIYKPYIRKFKSKAGTPCFFENFAGFYADQEPKLYSKIKELENETGCLVYAVTHELTEFGECWSMLCVGKNSKLIDECLTIKSSGQFYAFAYVWNIQNEHFSEFGDIVVQSAYGGIKRMY